MSKVVIAGDASGTGTFTISAPNGNTDRTLVLPDEAGTIITTAGVPASAMPAGSVLQVVSVSTPAQQTFNTTSFVNFSQLNCSITPTSASSKILVSYNIFIGNANDDAYNQFIAYRSVGGVLTALGLGDAIGGATRLSWGQNGPFTHAVYEVQNSSWQYLDSPATASTISYQLHARPMQTNIRTMYFNRPSDVGDGNRMATTSSVTLIEIAG